MVADDLPHVVVLVGGLLALDVEVEQNAPFFGVALRDDGLEDAVQVRRVVVAVGPVAGAVRFLDRQRLVDFPPGRVHDRLGEDRRPDAGDFLQDERGVDVQARALDLRVAQHLPHVLHGEQPQDFAAAPRHVGQPLHPASSRPRSSGPSREPISSSGSRAWMCRSHLSRWRTRFDRSQLGLLALLAVELRVVEHRAEDVAQHVALGAPVLGQLAVDFHLALAGRALPVVVQRHHARAGRLAALRVAIITIFMHSGIVFWLMLKSIRLKKMLRQRTNQLPM